MNAGDTLEIDSKNLKIYKNGNDITNLRIMGSVFPTIVGATTFVVTDADGRFLSDDFRVSGYFYSILR